MDLELKIYTKFAIPNLILGTLIIATNGFLIHALRKLNKLTTVSYKLILPSCISNICIGILVLISDTMIYLLTEKDYETFDMHDMAVLYAVSHNALFMTLAIAVDRYVHLKNPRTYSLIMTSKRAIMMVVFNIILSAAMASALLLGQKYKFLFIAQVCINVIIALLVVSISGLYIQAYISVAAIVKQSTVSMPSEMGSTKPPRRNASHRLSQAALFIVTSLVVCYMPHVVCSTLMYKTHHENSRWILIAAFSSQSLVYVNSILEAVFIITFNADLKGYLRGCVCVGLRPSSDNREQVNIPSRSSTSAA